MKLIKTCIIVLLAAALPAMGFAEEPSANKEPSAGKEPSANEEPSANKEPSLIDRMKAIDEVNPKSWGIRNNCIAVSRIRDINFRDDQSAIVDVGRGKEVLMRLRRECSGVKTEGFMYKPRGIRLCARHDYLTLIRSKRICHIASFEPYLEVQKPKPEDNK